MTDKLPPNLLALFAARPPLRYHPPADHPPEERRTHAITGVAAYLPHLNDEFGDYQPTESWLEAKDRRTQEEQQHHKYITGDGFKELFKPTEDANVRGDPFRTLFVGRLNYETDIKDLEREFGRFGPIDRIRIVVDTGESDTSPKKVNKNSRRGKSMGYGFVVFDREQDMKAAYKETDHLVIRGKKVLVDVERGRTRRLRDLWASVGRPQGRVASEEASGVDMVATAAASIVAAVGIEEEEEGLGAALGATGVVDMVVDMAVAGTAVGMLHAVVMVADEAASDSTVLRMARLQGRGQEAAADTLAEVAGAVGIATAMRVPEEAVVAGIRAGKSGLTMVVGVALDGACSSLQHRRSRQIPYVQMDTETTSRTERPNGESDYLLKG
ncbi:hypothetical protein B0A55_05130 [Friedmanniomyces simplex]|uniref:RRM domain-containing protein n=1 Tax=Friedmanniomyces simplex TaxID=329884 RepID=A0A4U0X4M3_9PEZI|nr:hypothetical protein B0A55_05130 [Friedmanniomyces simplex]